MSMGISAAIALLSLNLTASLVVAGQVAQTLPITNATTTSPVVITSTSHGIPPARVAHAVVSGVGSMPETNSTWVLTPVDANTLTLTTYDAQGNVVPCVGVNTYTGGGQAQIAFPDYQVLLGRQMLALASSAASPRIVFIPTTSKGWAFEAYGGEGPAPLRSRGTAEQQSATTQPQIATRYPTFEVHVTGAATPPQPNFGDLDATDMLARAVHAALFSMSGGRVSVLSESWPSQGPNAGSMTQRGEKWVGLVQIQAPVTYAALQFVPVGTSLVMTVEPLNPGSTDATIITVT
jgi:hypothetical protein